jgi:hypothetical protein
MAISSNQEELLDLVGRGKHPAPITGAAVAAREGFSGTIPQIRSKFRDSDF